MNNIKTKDLTNRQRKAVSFVKTACVDKLEQSSKQLLGDSYLDSYILQVSREGVREFKAIVSYVNEYNDTINVETHWTTNLNKLIDWSFSAVIDSLE